MAGLAVNIDHIATIREARKASYPDPIAAALRAEMAGADGIVAHLREDRRHVNDRDVRLLREVIQTRFILEMAATDEMLAIALEVMPELVTLVPEKREEVTTEGGLDLVANREHIEKAVTRLQDGGIPVSIFIDADLDQIRMAREVGADFVEIHTGAFCDAETDDERQVEMERIKAAAKLAHELELGVNAGHGINYDSVKAFKEVPEIDEYSIGHSIVARAAMVGMDQAVRDMAQLVKELHP
ncbi:MAG: pyridoxine 5'-phosphate synthase [Desulfobacterales bacterium]|nr:pyridoxine 5'-phosphate synthase [Desulfobacterales bacterium]